MPGFLKPFEGFTKEDFETYTEDKWSSNLFNLQRMQVKQKLTALGSAVDVRLSGGSLDLESETSAERPSIWNQKKVKSQWLYFYRDARAQKVLQSILDRERTIAENIDDPAHHHRHIVLAVRIDANGAAILCGLHRSAWIDRKNLQEKWGIPHERAKLLSILSSTGEEGYTLQVGTERWRASEVSEETLTGIFTHAVTLDGWISLGHQLRPEDPRVLEPSFVDTVVETFDRLRPFYQCCAWNKTNDHLSLAKVVVEEKKAKRRHSKAPFEENDTVEIVGGLFAGRRGIVAGYDRAGKVKVRVGTLALPVDAGSLKLVKP